MVKATGPADRFQVVAQMVPNRPASPAGRLGTIDPPKLNDPSESDLLRSVTESSPYWDEVLELDVANAPRAVQHVHRVDPEAEGQPYFTTLSGGSEFRSDDDWWVALPAAYERFYELLHHLNSMDDEDRRVQEGDYLEDDANVRRLRHDTELRPRLEAEAEQLAKYLASVSHNVLWWWVNGHLNHFHPMEGDLSDDLSELPIEEQIQGLEYAIKQTPHTIARYAPEYTMGQFARSVGISDVPDYWDEPNQDLLTRLDEAVQIERELVADDEAEEDDDEEGWGGGRTDEYERLEELSRMNSQITDSDIYKHARFKQLVQEHPQFQTILSVMKQFQDAKDWRDLIIPIDTAKNLAHSPNTRSQSPNVFSDYYGFSDASGANYQDTFDAISSGKMDPIWDERLRRARTTVGMMRLAQAMDERGQHDLVDQLDGIIEDRIQAPEPTPTATPPPSRPNLGQMIQALRPQLAAAAQAVYDGWEQDADGLDFEVGSGGICDRISEAMASVIVGAIPDVQIADGGAEGDDHAWLIVHDGQRGYHVDIPAHIYEHGGGYSWTKRPEVRFTPDDVEIAQIPDDWFPDGFGEEEDGW